MSGTVPLAPQVDPRAGVSGERLASPVSGGPGFSRIYGAGLMALAGAGAIALILWNDSGPVPAETQTQDEKLRVRSYRMFEAPPPVVAPSPTPAAFTMAPPPPPFLPQPPAPVATRATPSDDGMAKARKAPVLAYGSSGNASGASVEQAQAAAGQPPVVKLTATPLAAVTASVLQDQPFLLTMGEQFPCLLLTAMDSTMPGQVTCRTQEDVLGKTGIVLLDRGTRIVGEYQGGLQQGQSRLFVMWRRAETPQGVVITLDSPATDALGRAGMAGVVDTQFWERLKGTLLLSIVQGALQAGVAAASREGTTNLNLGQTDNVVADAFRGSVNIKPVLRKNAGEVVAVQTARDLSFRSVYSVGTVR